MVYTSPMSTDHHPFPQTHWSLVRRAQGADPKASLDALAILLNRYVPALHSYLRNVRRLSSHAADDLLQSFIADKFLERQLVRHAEQHRGRFRNFLLTSLNNYANSLHRKESTLAVSILSEADARDPHAGSPDSTLEAEWARVLLKNVLASMRDECFGSRREDVWIVFEKRILAPIYDNQSPESYALLTSELELASPTQTANLLVTAKRMYARLLRIAVAEYEPDEQSIDDEIRDLHYTLSIASPTQ
jgi:DNA-directed RNA polymerase specialized sigma24 family protein